MDRRTTSFDKKKGCVFCNILIKKDKVLYDDPYVFVFKDKRQMVARAHLLVCPRTHIKNTDDLTREHVNLVEHMEKIGSKLLMGIDAKATFRFGYHEPPINSVDHLHLHAFIEPITNPHLNNEVYGKRMTPTAKIIEKIKLRPPKATVVKKGSGRDTP